MTQREGAFRKALVAVLRSIGDKVQPIESELTGNGIPDLVACSDGFVFWMELKAPALPSTTNAKIAFRPKQHRWLREWYEAGGNAFVGMAYTDNVYRFVHIRDITEEDKIKPGCGFFFTGPLNIDKICAWLRVAGP